MSHTISLRVHLALWRDRPLFEQLLALLQEYREVVTEVAFFTASTHPPLRLATIREEAEFLGREAIPAVRALGLRTGINHLATLGHLDNENPEISLLEPWQHLVDISGAESASCYCAADPRVEDYIRQSYRALAAAKPDFIWMDDDVRLEHHPPVIRYACFCPFCLETFAQESGRPWTRETLRAQFNTGPQAERLALRRQWQAHIRQYLARLISLIRTTVDEVNPHLTLGLMTGEVAYCTYDYAAWVDSLAGSQGLDVMWRPGSGFYTDELPIGALHKAHSMGRQVASLPARVVNIQYELENFPYQILRKSRTAFAAEIAAAMGAGCTGVALNLLDMHDSPLASRPYFDKIRATAGFYAAVAETFGRSACEGIYIPFTPQHFSALNIDGAWEDAGSWGADFAQYNEVSEIGLPMAFSPEGGAITLLTPENCVEYTPDALRHLLSGAVMMDGRTVERLTELGLGDLLGFRVSGRHDQNALEQNTAHALNGDFAGYHRDCRPSFYAEPVYLLERTAEGAEVLSEIVDFNYVVYGAGAGVYENALGGRIAVFGYYPWRMIQNAARTTQMKAICHWISRRRLPAYVASCHKMAIWCRRDASGQVALLLLNVSLDTAEDIEICLHGDASPMVAIDMDAHAETLTAHSAADGYVSYRLAQIPPWQAVLLRR